MGTSRFLTKVEHVVGRFREVEAMLSDPEVTSDLKKLTALSKERSDLQQLVEKYTEYVDAEQGIADAQEMIRDGDPEMVELAQEEIRELQALIPQLEEQMKLMLLPKDPLDEKNILLEVRAGTGGEEAALFAAELYRMYCRFAERRRWKVEVMSSSMSGSGGGFKEIIAMISGNEVYSWLKFESGVHRVQRVPLTESQGRVHTSAATVAIMPEAQDIELKIEDKDLKIDVMRAGGPGGQSVNTTDSAVRIHHIPTGLIVICQDEKSQHKNKAKALKILKIRLYEMERAKQEAARRDERRTMVGSGDRSEKIRTYNYPQDRLTDHRINYTRHNLPGALDGDLEDVISNLRAHHQAELLQAGI
ncbi:peptide chain release factor 1 [Myxococcota bacterium]|nr:peptide chain release factor 1 [Myxococcota bacterium]